MNIIKLNAINSTNDYLKSLVSTQFIDNFTIVSAEAQTQGKGQMGALWSAEAGKNLTFSILIKDLLTETLDIFTLNVAVANAIAHVVSDSGIPDVSIKWPNDILADSKKIGGILIENTIKSDSGIYSTVGIGLNVNQTNFEGLPKASSMAVQAGREFDKETVMVAILNKIKELVTDFKTNKSELWEAYHNLLYKRGIPMAFEQHGVKFMGIIKEVSPSGFLVLKMEDETLREFGVKEIKMLY